MFDIEVFEINMTKLAALAGHLGKTQSGFQFHRNRQ
jgi:hypothetical protein